ncbi:MAG: triose-phosphate isomerase [Alphaproteobacteria bacterium]|nr:triose-phosphate isomerase [Alphaproteobacteria bacterium]
MKIIVGNWKMNGSSQLLTDMLARVDNKTHGNRVILCVPYTLLRHGTKHIEIGAQDISEHESGAFTGQISASMVRAAGAKYTIVGHSEVRTHNKDSNKTVKSKAIAAISAGITPIICVGETGAEHKSGNTTDIIKNIVKGSVPKTDANTIVAYEPRWAIGAGITPTVREITDVHRVIHQTLTEMGMENTPILYGASVTGANVAKITSIKYVDGVLVGGASLKIDDFVTIIRNVK